MKNKVLLMIINSNKIDFNKLKYIYLIKNLINKIKFDSGDNDLNEFLYEESVDYCKSNLAVVYLVFQEKELIAYFSLSSDSVKINEKLEIKLK